jgi:RES domain-containing protein
LILSWGICKKKHEDSAFDGEGARIAGGRWNDKGTSVVYTSEHQSLAALEIFVQPNILDNDIDWVIFEIKIPSNIEIKELTKHETQKLTSLLMTREYGSAWARSGKTAILKVPSIIIPSENNYIINPLHSDFKKLKITNPTPFRFDARLLKK